MYSNVTNKKTVSRYSSKVFRSDTCWRCLCSCDVHM